MKSRNNGYLLILIVATLAAIGIKFIVGDGIGWDFVSYPIIYIPLIFFCILLLQKIVATNSIEWTEVMFPYTVLLGLIIILFISMYGMIVNFINSCIDEIKK